MAKGADETMFVFEVRELRIERMGGENRGRRWMRRVADISSKSWRADGTMCSKKAFHRIWCLPTVLSPDILPWWQSHANIASRCCVHTPVPETPPVKKRLFWQHTQTKSAVTTKFLSFKLIMGHQENVFIFSMWKKNSYVCEVFACVM